MNFKIRSRDIKFFILGIFAMFIFIIIYDWSDFVDGFNDGFNGRYNKIEKVENGIY